MRRPVVNIEHLYKSFESLQAIVDLSCQISQSTCYGFLGPNGAGKTTTMKMIYGKSERDFCDQTKLQVFGLDPKTHALQIKYISGVVPQENNLDDELNVTQNLQVYGRFYGMAKSERKQRIAELLDFFELSEKAHAKLRELSGGMKRRLIIARALMHDPQLLILDEPTTGLDPQVRHLIWDKLRQLKKEGLTILLTTHYMEEAFQICDQICIMDKGRMILNGPPQSLLAEHIESYVLELTDSEVLNNVSADWESPEVRKDVSMERPIYYAQELDVLKKMADRLNHGAYYLRQSNLEDLFLKMTGRQLNEIQ